MTDPTTERRASASDAGVLELLRLFRGHEAAADRYAAACLERAKAIEPLLKAFEYLPVDTARRPGPLSGIPVAIKDIIATSDMPTTNGSPVYKGYVPDADAWVVERLRNLGATIFGKTVSTEFAWRHPILGTATIRRADRHRGRLRPSPPGSYRWRSARRRLAR